MCTTTTKVKCVSCNIIIDEVLAFIVNKLDVMDEDSICKICTSAFTEQDIQKAKDLLFGAVPTSKRNITRKRDGKARRDIDDIICLLKESDPEVIPTFVARDLQKLPPVLFDHVDVTRLLKDIVKLQRDMVNVKENYATIDQLHDLRNEFQHISLINTSNLYVNKQRGGARNCDHFDQKFCCDSGPMGLPDMSCIVLDRLDSKACENKPVFEQGKSNALTNTQSKTNKSTTLSTKQSPQVSPVNLKASISVSPMTTDNIDLIDKSQVLPTEHETCRKSIAIIDCESTIPVQATLKLAENKAISPKSKSVNLVNQTEGKQNTDMQNSQNYLAPKNLKTVDGNSFSEKLKKPGWWAYRNMQADKCEAELKSARGRFNRFKGKKGTATLDDKFQAAETNVPLYVYNVSKGTTPADIKEYLKVKAPDTRVGIVKMSMRHEKDYDAYKVFVPKSKLGTFMKNDFWPNKIRFRRFYDFPADKMEQGDIKRLEAATPPKEKATT